MEILQTAGFSAGGGYVSMFLALAAVEALQPGSMKRIRIRSINMAMLVSAVWAVISAIIGVLMWHTSDLFVLLYGVQLLEGTN